MQRYLESVQFENIEEVDVTLCAMWGQRGQSFSKESSSRSYFEG